MYAWNFFVMKNEISKYLWARNRQKKKNYNHTFILYEKRKPMNKKKKKKKELRRAKKKLRYLANGLFYALCTIPLLLNSLDFFFPLSCMYTSSSFYYQTIDSLSANHCCMHLFDIILISVSVSKWFPRIFPQNCCAYFEKKGKHLLLLAHCVFFNRKTKKPRRSKKVPGQWRIQKAAKSHTYIHEEQANKQLLDKHKTAILDAAFEIEIQNGRNFLLSFFFSLWIFVFFFY